MISNIQFFPLNTVLFPGGYLPLRIFEVRYLDMVSESLRNQSPFGVCLITQGNEVGTPADFHEVGTFAHIVDWEKGDDGLLGITVQGGKRFRVLNKHIRKNNLQAGDVEVIDDRIEGELPVEHQLLSDLLRQIGEKFELDQLNEHEKYLDANWVGCRLAEVLPLELSDKQILLETNDPIQRLEQIQILLQSISVEEK